MYHNAILSSQSRTSVSRAGHVRARTLRQAPGGYRLTPRGFDVYHDLERLVTYQFIEPLWAEMLTEHLAEPGAAEGRVRWVAPEQGAHWAILVAGTSPLRAVAMTARPAARLDRLAERWWTLVARYRQHHPQANRIPGGETGQPAS